jgi:hypothetical protein
VGGCLVAEPFFEGLVEPFYLAAGLRMVGAAVLEGSAAPIGDTVT